MILLILIIIEVLVVLTLLVLGIIDTHKETLKISRADKVLSLLFFINTILIAGCLFIDSIRQIMLEI